MSDFPSPTGFYKVLDSDLRPYHGGAGEWQVGVERRVEGDLIPCLRGLHAVTLEQLPRWLGPAIHPVTAVSDERRGAADKWVFRSMTIGEAYETWDERSQRHFGCDCAEQALAEAKRLGWRDERCDEAVRIARLYADGLADEAALAAARAAAESAAWAAAESAAESAAWVAARAAESAAGWAPWSAAGSAAVAAWATAWAAWAAAWAATAVRATADARAWQVERLALYLAGELS